MANEFDLSVLDEQQDSGQVDNGSDLSILDEDVQEEYVPETEGEAARQIQLPGVGPFSSLLKIDTKTGGVGIDVPDLNFDALKIDDVDDGDGKTSFSESLANTWNNSLNQLSLTDDRFYWLSEYLFGDTESANFQESEAQIAETEATGGETIGFTDVDDIYAEEGLIGAIGGVTAATINAASSFATSAVQSAASGGAALAVDMVQSGIRGFNVEKAEANGVTLDELIENGDAETLIPGALGALAYRFEKAGIKGVGKAIKAMPNGAKKAFVEIMNAAGKEGGTEFAQGIVEAFSDGLGKYGNDAIKAGADVGTWIQEEGLETFLQGAVGGGVSAGGGRAIRKAKGQLRSRDAEQAIVKDSKEILELDKILNDPNVPKEQKDIVARARRDLKKNVEEAIKEPNKIVNQLDDKEIAKVNKHGDKIKELRKELKETEILGEDVNDIVKDNINNRVQKEIDGINKIVENRRSEVRREDAGGENNIAINERIKEEGKEAVGAYEAIEAYVPLIKSVASRVYKKHPGFSEQGYSYEDFVEDLKYGTERNQASSALGLFNDFNPEIGSWGGHLKSKLGQRAKRIIQERIGEDITVTTGTGELDDIGTDQETTQDNTPRVVRKLVNKLGFDNETKAKTATEIEDIVEDIASTQEFDTTSEKEFGKDIRKTGRKKLYKIVDRELGTQSKNNNTFNSNLAKNWNNYLKIIPKIALSTSQGQTKAWAENPPSQKEFVQYFRGVDILQGEGTDRQKANAISRRRKSLKQWVADGLFATALKDVLQAKPEIAEKFELVNKLNENVGDAITKIGAVLRVLADKVPISENRVKGPAEGQIVKSTKSAVQNLTDTMSQAWNKNKRVSVYATTDRTAAIGALLDAGYKTEKEAGDYLKEIDGFTFVDSKGTRFIYNAKDSSLDTPVHEFSHVWSAFLQDNNPVLWKEGVKVLLKDPIKRNYQLDRLKGNYSGNKNWSDALKRLSKEGITDAEIDNIINRSDLDTRHVLDEMLAGEIGDKGRERVIKAQFGPAHTEYNWQAILDNIWDYIGELLANVKGKEIRDLTANEFLDLAVNDVMKGTPGAAFAEMNIPVGSNQFENIQEQARSELKANAKPAEQKEQAKYDGLNSLNKLIDSGKDVTPQDISDSYAQVSDYYTQQEWNAEITKTLNSRTSAKIQETLQKSFDESDIEDDTNDALWRKLVGTTKKIGKLLGRPAKEWQNDEARIEQKFDENQAFFQEYQDEFSKYLPKGFWLAISNLKRDGSQDKTAILRRKDAEVFAESAEDDGLTWDNADAISHIKTKDTVAKLLKFGNSDSYKAEVEQNQAILFALGDAIANLSKEGVPTEVLATLVKSFGNSGNNKQNFFRKAPSLAGFSSNLENLTYKGEDGKKVIDFVPEHNPPAGFIAMTMFEQAINNTWNAEAKKAVADKYKYWALDKKEDPGTNIGPRGFQAGITKGFNLLTDNPLVRYVASGGDIGTLRNLDGTYVAQEYGIDKKFLQKAEDSKALADAINNIAVSEINPKEQKLTDDAIILTVPKRPASQKGKAPIGKREDKFGGAFEADIWGDGGNAQGNREFVEYAAQNWIEFQEVENKKVHHEGPFLTQAFENFQQVPRRRGTGPLSFSSFKNTIHVFSHPKFKEAIVAYGQALDSNDAKDIANKRQDIDNLAAFWEAYKKGEALVDDQYPAKVGQISEKRRKKIDGTIQSEEEIFGLKDAQFKNLIARAKKLGAYLDGDEDLQLHEISRIISRIKKAEAAKVKNPVTAEKLSVFDFDDTLYKTNNKVVVFHKDGSSTVLDSDQFATYTTKEGDELDFADFDNVTEPQGLPDLKKLGEALKAGDDVTILTARTMNASDPIMKLLRKRFGTSANRIKFKGVAHSSPKAKADYIKNAVKKYGYKNVLFMDDSVNNLEAVDNIIKELGVEGEAVESTYAVNERTRAEAKAATEAEKQARRDEKQAIRDEKAAIREAKKLLNEKKQEIKDNIKKWQKLRSEREDSFVTDLLKANDKNVGTPSQALAREQGAERDSFKIFGKRFKKLKFFLPPGAEDLKGLLYTLLGEGKPGDKQWKMMGDKLLKPFAYAEAAIARKKVESFKGLKQLMDAFKKTGIDLEDNIPGSNKVTYEQAVRFYMNTLQDPELRDKITGDKTSYDKAMAVVRKDPALQNLAEGAMLNFGGMSKWTPEKFWGGNLKTDLIGYINKEFRSEVLKPWQEAADRIFSKDNLNKLEAAYGTQWRVALEDSLRRMKSGKNRQHSNNATLNRFQDWINNSVATTMMLNFRSGFLQTLSALNFINAPGNNIFKASKAFANQPQFWSDFAHLFNSDFLKNRRGGQSWDISADEITQLSHGKNAVQTVMAKMFEIGFKPTQIMDSFAIALGGASWYRNALKDGMTEQEAMIAFQEISEEGQQSSRTDKISSLQASSLGRIVFAFANTPLQYARLTKRAAQDLYKRRGSDKNNLSKLVWYGAAQGIIFATIQNAVLAAFALGDDEEEKKKELTDQNLNYGIQSFISSWLKGWGFPGAIASTLYGTAAEIDAQQSGEKRGDAYKVAEKVLAISPTVSIKFRDIVKAYRSWTYKQEKNKIENLPVWHKENPFLESIFTATTAATNVSAPEVLLSMVNRFREMDTDRNNLVQNLALLAGYNAKYQLGLEPSIDDKIQLSLDLAEGKIKNLDKKIQRSIDRSLSPLDRSEAGQTFNDGTIQVDPNLSPIEREKTIAHEQEHVRQMNEDGLDYDDNFVYYKGAKHRRKNGNIRYNGKWMKEGDKKFPWEAHAYEAESPIARIDDKDKKKEDEKYIRNPEHIEQVNKSRDRFEQHYSDPVTEELYRQNTGFNDLSGKVDNALNTRIQTGFVPQGAKATYDPAIGDYKGAITVEDYRDPAVVDHELTHAAGFDEALGKEAQKILGKPKSGDKYLSKPSEVYGNLHEFRTRLDLKGFERNLNPKKVKDLIKFNELENDPDIKQMIDEFGLENLSKALNKIASNKEKPTLEGLYG